MMIDEYCEDLDGVSRVSHSSHFSGCNLSGTLPPEWCELWRLDVLYETERKYPQRFDLFNRVTSLLE